MTFSLPSSHPLRGLRPVRSLRRLGAALGMAASLLAPAVASADAIKVFYAGVLTSVAGSQLADFFGGVEIPTVGSNFTGGFIFDLNTPDSDAAPNVAVYSGGNSSFFIDFGLDSNGMPRQYQQDLALPYNHGEVGNNFSDGSKPAHDVWTAYGQLANNKGYEYVETGMVLLSFFLDSLMVNGFPLPGQLNPDHFTLAGGCDPGGVGAAAGLSCARDMEFHAKKDRGGDPFNIYGDVDIHGFITALGMERLTGGGQLPLPGSLALVLLALSTASLASTRRVSRG
jgi:hypothetical protein